MIGITLQIKSQMIRLAYKREPNAAYNRHKNFWAVSQLLEYVVCV